MSATVDSPPHPSRVRCATKRFKEYGGGDNLTLFSQSVGIPAPPPDPNSHTAEQIKNQKAAAKARGNATQPDPLSPAAKRRKTSGSKTLIDRSIDDLHTEEDRVEWLYQVLEKLDDKTDYRGDPDMQDSATLWEVYQDLLDGGGANDDPGTAPEPQPNAHVIRSGMLKEVKTYDSGRRIGVKLVPTDRTTLGRDSPSPSAHHRRDSDQPVRAPAKLARTDHTTLGLDGYSPHAHLHHEFGQPVCVPAPNLVRTNHTTLGLDGAPPLPPKSQVAPRHNTTAKPSTNVRGQNPPRPTTHAPTTNQPAPTPTTTRPIDNLAALKKRLTVSRARVNAIHEENRARSLARKGEVAGTSKSAMRMPAPPGPMRPSLPNPLQAVAAFDGDGDVEMANLALSGDEPPEPLPPQAGEEQEQADGALPGGQDDNNNNDSDSDNDGNDTPGENQRHRRRRTRQDALLAAFGHEGAQLGRYVIGNIKVKVATTCGFPEHVRSVEDPEKMFLEVWIPRFWAATNSKYQPDQPHLPLEDCHSRYVRSQLSTMRNGMKKWAEPIVPIYFDLDRSDPDHAKKACDLISDEKWLSPNLANDKDIFKHKIIRDVIKFSFFRSTCSLGVKNRACFIPLVPLETIAYACAI
ncbi:hypothetical protein FRC06_009752, partial [Ceratobasidium sp. 370]